MVAVRQRRWDVTVLDGFTSDMKACHLKWNRKFKIMINVITHGNRFSSELNIFNNGRKYRVQVFLKPPISVGTSKYIFNSEKNTSLEKNWNLTTQIETEQSAKLQMRWSTHWFFIQPFDDFFSYTIIFGRRDYFCNFNDSQSTIVFVNKLNLSEHCFGLMNIQLIWNECLSFRKLSFYPESLE